MREFFCTVDCIHLHEFHQAQENFEYITRVTDDLSCYAWSLSAPGRGSEESRSHTSLTIGDTTVYGSGWEGGRDGGNLR